MSMRMRTLLAVSLLLNILFIGIFAGHVLEMMVRTAHPPPIDANDFNLSGEQLQRIQNRLHGAHLGNRARLERIREEKEEALRIVEDKPFDEAAYQERVDTIHELRGRSVQQIAEVVKKLAPTLNDDERGVLAAMLRRPPPEQPLLDSQ